MLYIILSSFILLALLDRTVRGGRVRLAKLDFEFSLFTIRDILREYAIAEEISYSRWFDYMDTTLTRTIESTHAVNPWTALGYALMHRNDNLVKSGSKELREALDRPENYKLARVYAMYTEALSKFLKRRFPLSWPVAAIIFALVFSEKSSPHDSVEQEERRLAPIFSFTPETSTFSEYVTTGKNLTPEVGASSLAL